MRALLHRLRATATAAAGTDRVADRNRLDELLPGSGTRYDRRTGNVLAVDLRHAEARLKRIETLGLIASR